MTVYELTPKHEAIVKEMLKQYDAGNFDEFRFNQSYAHSGFLYDGGHTIGATALEMRSLMNARIINADIFDDGSANCSLNEPIARDVLRQRGAMKEQRILEAIYDLTDGNALKRAAAPEIIKRARVSESDLQGALVSFAGSVDGCNGPGGPFLSLTAEGIRRVRGAGKMRGGASSVNINQINLHNSAFAVGDGNEVNFQVNRGIDSAQTIEMLNKQSAEMMLQMNAVQILLAGAIADLKAGKDKEPGWGDRLVKLAEAGGKFAEFGSKLLDLKNLFQ